MQLSDFIIVFIPAINREIVEPIQGRKQLVILFKDPILFHYEQQTTFL